MAALCPPFSEYCKPSNEPQANISTPHAHRRRSRRTMRALYELVANQQRQWQVAITHIQSLADGDAVEQLFYQDGIGFTATIYACYCSAPLELVQLIITKAKLDSRKMCLLAIITESNEWTTLHCATNRHSDPAVLELLIREHPLALCAANCDGKTPHRPAPFTSLLIDATNALAASDYAALAARVHGDKFALRCLASPSYAARIAVRTSLLLCLKNVHPDVPFTPTEPLDLRLAHASLQRLLESHPRVGVGAERRSKCRRQLCL